MVRALGLDRSSENSMFRELVGMLRAPAYFCDADFLIGARGKKI